MQDPTNETHDPRIRSWVKSGSFPGTDFPIQNLPLGIFKRRGEDGHGRAGTAIGDQIVDIAGCLDAGLLEGSAAQAAEACRDGALNGLMALGRTFRSALRLRLSRLLRSDCPDLQSHPSLVGKLLVPMSDAELFTPAHVGDYSDFYASLHHATNVGSMFRPGTPLLSNYRHLPVGYHGRASSIVASGTGVRRPVGQIQDGEAAQPRFGPSRQMDYELEIGFYVGPGNPLGTPIAIGRAWDHIFGLSLLNDWSARDIQRWEYQPLGPFLSKSFATSVSPWIVTQEALEPFRTAAFRRPEEDPKPLAYLCSQEDSMRGAIDLYLEVLLSSEEMLRRGMAPARLSLGNFRDMYWTAAQMLTHHASNGCNMRPGDLLASGTVSGKDKESRGCLLELTWRGTEPISLPTGEQRRFLEDGDEVILRGYCRRPGFVDIGLGECRGVILPSNSL